MTSPNQPNPVIAAKLALVQNCQRYIAMVPVRGEEVVTMNDCINWLAGCIATLNSGKDVG